MLYFQTILSNHKNNPLPITCRSPLYSSSNFLETTNLFCDSLHLPILGISDKENPIPCASISFSVWLKSIQQYWSTVLYLSLHQLMDIHAECCHLYLIWVSVCGSDKWPAKLFPKIDLPFYISLIGESSSLHFYRHLILDYFILWRSGFCCTGFFARQFWIRGSLQRRLQKPRFVKCTGRIWLHDFSRCYWVLSVHFLSHQKPTCPHSGAHSHVVPSEQRSLNRTGHITCHTQQVIISVWWTGKKNGRHCSQCETNSPMTQATLKSREMKI